MIIMRNSGINSRIIGLYAQMWTYQAIGLAVLAVARIVWLFTLGAFEQSDGVFADSLPLFLYNSFRFDIQAITYISLPAILALLAVPFFEKGTAAVRCARFMRHYYAVMLSMLVALVVAEFFFYSNFNVRYNVVFFDFFDEGPWGLLQTMWQDYPMFTIMAFVLAVGVVIDYAGVYVSRISFKPKKAGGAILTLLLVIIVAGTTFIFMRGSVTRYTLQVEAFIVSTNDAVNNAVPNCLYLLKKAYKERVNSFKLRSEEALLASQGFSTLDEAITVAGLPLCDAGDKLHNALFATVESAASDSSLQSSAPNILLILNESWSSFLLAMDKGDSLDLMCSLRSHINNDVVIKNFTSVRNGTIYSIEAVTMAMPYQRFFNSKYRFDAYGASIAAPFKESGYSTAFIVGMDPTWENIREGLTVQHFDTVIGRREVMEALPGSSTSTIGVYDEFLYEYILRRMEQRAALDSPQFIVALTTTNHPPFTYPEGMSLPPLTDEWYQSPYLTGDRDVLRKYGLGAQYANKSLGDFLTRFKASPMAGNTIVVVTGDHNVRSILDYSVVPAEYKYSVPLYICLPPRYAVDAAFKEQLAERYGSHYDILPTLAPLALKEGSEYLCIGRNLLDSLCSDDGFFGYNQEAVLAPDAQNADSLMRVMKARELLMEIYYQQGFRQAGSH